MSEHKTTPAPKLTDRELIRRALQDAIGWQESLADAQRGLPDEADAMGMARLYRRLMKRRYGTNRLPMEEALANAKPSGLDELRRMADEA